MEVYAYRQGYSFRNIHPQVLGEELRKIREANNGELTPEIVLRAASDPKSPLHSAFEWDDSTAARQWRLSQARRVIVSVRVINTPVRPPVPVYVSVSTPNRGRQYVPTVEALTDEQIRARVLDDIRRTIESLERRYGHFVQVAEILDRLKRAAG